MIYGSLQDLIDESSIGELQNAVAILGKELRERVTGGAEGHRRFRLQRHEDVSHISGEGFVAEGCMFSNGIVVIQWKGPHASTVVWPSLDHALAIHGHGGRTEVIWIDDAA